MDTLRLDPEPSILIESLRDIGYSFNSALADIIDNSITANATQIDIYARPIDDVFKVAVIDNGNGLAHDDLKQAMRLGSTDPRKERALNDLGRFGLGLKTASFSQCRRLTVASRKLEQTSVFTWDLDIVVNNNSWTVLERSHETDIAFLDQLGPNGTLVLWENLDRLTGSKNSNRVNFDRVVSEAQDYLSLVFHRFLSGEHGLKKISINVNGRNLEPIDPFNTKHRATQASPAETVCQGVTMQAFTLPHRSNYNSGDDYERYGLAGGYLKSQGVYLYRAKRLILYGTWFGIAKKTALTQLCRVKIDIDINQDELWKVDVKKVSAELPEVVRSRLKSLINTIGAPSKKVYKRRGTQLTQATSYPTWNVVKSNESTTYVINREHPVVSSLAASLDEDDRKSLEATLSLIEASFPIESLFYEVSNKEDSVSAATIPDEPLRIAASSFFAALKQEGKEDDTILATMRNIEPFSSMWDSVLRVMGITEE